MLGFVVQFGDSSFTSIPLQQRRAFLVATIIGIPLGDAGRQGRCHRSLLCVGLRRFDPPRRALSQSPGVPQQPGRCVDEHRSVARSIIIDEEEKNNNKKKKKKKNDDEMMRRRIERK